MIINSNIIPEFVRIDESILVLMNNLKYDSPEFDDEQIIKYIKMFITKEKRLMSQIPQDSELIKIMLDNLYEVVLNNISNPDNFKFISARIKNYLNDQLSKIKPSTQYVHVYNGQQFYVHDCFLEFDYKLKTRFYFNNLCVRYLNSLEDLRQLGIYDDNFLTDVEYYNLFINRDLFEEFIDKDLKISNLSLLTDENVRRRLEFGDKEFDELKEDVITSMTNNLLSIMLNNPNDSIEYLDAQLNFKFYINEISLSNLTNIAETCTSTFNEYFASSGKNVEDCHEVISFVNDFLEEEIKRKSSISSDNNLNIKPDEFEKLNSFVCLELKLLEFINNMNFDTCSSDCINKINNLLRLEDDFVDDFSNYSLIELSNFFTNGLSKILGENSNGRTFKLISYRLMHRFPIFDSLSKSSSQSSKTYNVINRNYIISSVKNYYDVIKKIDNEKIKSQFMKLYKNQFYMNPDLTELLVFLNGNHEMIEPFDDAFSCEISNVDEIEYYYDLSEQLFPEIFDIMNELFMFGSGIQDVDNAYFQFRFLQFNYISNILDIDSLVEAAEYLENNFDNKSGIYNLLYNILMFNINDYQYAIDIDISDSNSKINFIGK